MPSMPLLGVRHRPDEGHTVPDSADDQASVALNWHNCLFNRLRADKRRLKGRDMIRRRRSKLHGWGVFAEERINKNKRIIDYAGEKISHQESLRRERRYIKKGTIWCFQINRRWVRDAAVGGNVARFINHSCH